MKRTLISILAAAITLAVSTPAFAGQWVQDQAGWWYQNDDGGWTTDGWQEIDGKWYYFNEYGYMLAGTRTPDGYWVNANGEWTERIRLQDGKYTGDGCIIYSIQNQQILAGSVPVSSGLKHASVSVQGDTINLNSRTYQYSYSIDGYDDYAQTIHGEPTGTSEIYVDSETTFSYLDTNSTGWVAIHYIKD